MLSQNQERDAHYHAMIPQNANAINQEKEIHVTTSREKTHTKLSTV